MRELDFYFVDVFAREPLAGNPLAVVADADALAVETMRRLAREFNQSETTFIMKPARPDADWRLRFFTTTGAEVYGAGHNALGAWWWLAADGRLAHPKPRRQPESAQPAQGSSTAVTFAQEIGDRVLPVDIIFERGTLSAVAMTQAPPTFGAVQQNRPLLAAALRIQETDLADDPLLPQVVSTGVAHLLVPLRTRGAVDRVRPDVERLVPVVRALEGQGCYVFALDPIDPAATAHARFFNPAVGIAEDPATGSAAGPLGCYLAARGFVDDGVPAIVEQGHAVGRPSRIEVRVDGDRVQVLGTAVVVARGRIGVG